MFLWAVMLYGPALWGNMLPPSFPSYAGNHHEIVVLDSFLFEGNNSTYFGFEVSRELSNDVL
jgi:hypothetical protein